ncbi:CCR4-NOT core DEDD family RNase subunit POP2 SCDLUD_003784 [Saccharomycodes ludwigii]|uniref:CCR4-NOT core DEDD family RNase subunit POP2 n=1 Tax=Saccharomycodes ludwigii TaxID=36035 RepID=UPI001E853BD0|nr:hypothetical protein SCDLUD_003784 [Saccharomycodes ludwigii]KAH3900778.1 hypothetical protein SCDLUD_003784 [Saccharomycodes ludwigii]
MNGPSQQQIHQLQAQHQNQPAQQQPLFMQRSVPFPGNGNGPSSVPQSMFSPSIDNNITLRNDNEMLYPKLQKQQQKQLQQMLANNNSTYNSTNYNTNNNLSYNNNGNTTTGNSNSINSGATSNHNNNTNNNGNINSHGNNVGLNNLNNNNNTNNNHTNINFNDLLNANNQHSLHNVNTRAHHNSQNNDGLHINLNSMPIPQQQQGVALPPPPGAMLRPEQQQHFPNSQQQHPGTPLSTAGNIMNFVTANDISLLPPVNHLNVKQVWKHNLYEEFANIRKLVDTFNVISINIEFSGTLARPVGKFRSKSDYIYQLVRSNVDLLSVMQIGVSLSDEMGNKPDNVISTWQLNFKYDVDEEIVSPFVLDLVNDSIDFGELKKYGIEFQEFASLIMDSGLILNDNVLWISYSGAYHLAYLVHFLSGASMPNNKEDFLQLVSQYLPNFYDLEVINNRLKRVIFISNNNNVRRSIEILAEELGIPNFPHFQTTGGQSLLILMIYNSLCKLTACKFPNGEDFAIYKNQISGINDFFENNAGTAMAGSSAGVSIDGSNNINSVTGNLYA